MINREHDLCINRQAELLGMSRVSVTFLPRAVSETDLALMGGIDKWHMEHPFMGARTLHRIFRREGLAIGRYYAATRMKRMGIEAL